LSFWFLLCAPGFGSNFLPIVPSYIEQPVDVGAGNGKPATELNVATDAGTGKSAQSRLWSVWFPLWRISPTSSSFCLTPHCAPLGSLRERASQTVQKLLSDPIAQRHVGLQKYCMRALGECCVSLCPFCLGS
jgi:hypothetical protein